MSSEFMEALNALEKERGIDKAILLEAIETALISAYRRNNGASSNLRVEIDEETGAARVFEQKQVVIDVQDSELEISLEQARKEDPLYEPEDIYEREVTPKQFGRIAAQTAKQVVVQRIREAERGMIYDEFLEKENEVLNAIVQRVERRMVYVELGRTEGTLPLTEQIPTEHYMPGMRMKVYLLEVKKTNKGPQVTVSRSHPGLLRRLLELEVPEVSNGIIQIKAIAREAGSRTKVAVVSNDPSVDPVGSCIGTKGMRIENIVEELHGEKIDVIKWVNNPAEYISNALSPARAVWVNINEEEKIAKVVVPDNQLSLAIGKEGQNARLAAKLTGWKVDIKSQSQVDGMFVDEEEDA